MTTDPILDLAARAYEHDRAQAAAENGALCTGCELPYTECTCCPFCLTPDPEHCWWCSDAEHRERMAEWRSEL